MSIDYLDYVLIGQHFVAAYEGDDHTGLSDKDSRLLNEYIKKNGHFSVVIDDDDEPLMEEMAICQISRKYDHCYYVKHQSL